MVTSSETQLSNATIVTFTNDAESSAAIIRVANAYNEVIGSHPSVTTSHFSRSTIAITNNIDWFVDRTGNSKEYLNGDNSSGRPLGGMASTRVNGEYTIWVRDNGSELSPGLILHEIMHYTHTGLGAGQPHKPEFYLAHGEITRAMGFPADPWNGPAISDWYNDKETHLPGGNQFEGGIAKYGLTDDQMGRLIKLGGEEMVYTLYENLSVVYGAAIAEKISQSYMRKTGNDLTPHCFTGDTPVLLENGIYKRIDQIEVGDFVMAFDVNSGGTSGELVARPVVRRFENFTDTFFELTFEANDIEKHQLPSLSVVVTPGHRFLTKAGTFKRVDELSRLDQTELILADGSIVFASTQKKNFNEMNAGMYETAFANSAIIAGNTLMKSEVPVGWMTFNIEVEGLHTYIANGIRVHNDSEADFYSALGASDNNVFVTETNDLGGVSEYLNEQGNKVTTREGSNYSKSMLEHYGRETVDSDGNVTAGMTLGGHFRALGDWLGFDGEFGVQGSYADEETEGSDKPARDAAKPVVIDLDGDGVEINSSSQVSFDWDNDGYLESGNWAAADDGFLVVDLDASGNITADGGDGVIDQGKEIAFSQWSDEEMTDLQALAEARDDSGNLIFDTNGDGFLTSADAVWNSMKIFQDLDQDGEVDDGELLTLDQWGITQINLSYDDGSSFSEYEDDVVALGNILHGLASYVRNGETVAGGVGDVSLLYNTQGWRNVETANGYTIEFEEGEGLAFWHMDQVASANANLTTNSLAGAYGDDRNNVLDATGSTEQVVISGGAGSDTITGGDGDDLLTGGLGADTIHGGAGHDVIMADSQDDISGGAVTGGDGYDKLIVSQETTLNISDLGAIGFEAVEGGGGNDIISATDDGSYSISGNSGNDTISTAGGYDVLAGGEGNDTLSGGAGSDRLFGGEGVDTLFGGDDGDFLAGGAGDDRLEGGAGDDTYHYNRGDGHDTIYDFATGTIWERMEYSESVQYGSGKNASYANELRTGLTASTGQIDGGIDTLEFGYGISVEDILFTRTGDDVLLQFGTLDDPETDADESGAVEVDDSVTIENWTDQRSRIENFSLSSGLVLNVSQVMQGQFGGAEANALTGTDEGDWLNSGAGADTLTGNDGDDILIAGAGNDTASGGDGRDYLFGGAGADTLNGDAGDDYILGGDGGDTLNGGEGDDALSGDGGDDVINGGAGKDIILGGTGSDTLNGGAGDDTYIYFRGDGHDIIHDYVETLQDVQEATGNTVYQRSGKSGAWVQEMRTVQKMLQIDGGWDVLQFGPSVMLADVFFELDGNDLVAGIRQLDEDGNELALADMDDVVTVQDWTNDMSRVEELRFGNGMSIDISEFGTFQSGYETDDNFTGTDVGDLLSGGGGNDTLSGEGGDDVLAAGSGNDTVFGGEGEDDIFGGDGDDILKGGAAKDYIRGGAGNDTIEGGAGDDVLIGGAGDDILRGGLGNDTYIFNRGDGHDTIDEGTFSVTDGGVTSTEYGAEDFAVHTETAWTGGKHSYAYEKNVWISEARTGASVTALDGGDDVLQFGNYIDISDLLVSTDGTGASMDLIIELQPVMDGEDVTDSITVENWGTDEFKVETVRFSNGFSLDISDIEYAETGDADANQLTAAHLTWNWDLGPRGAWLVGLEGADTLTGSMYNDVLIGGADDDRVEGGSGNDTYVFGRGDGHDTIFDIYSTTVGTNSGDLGGDRLLFGAGIEIEDLILQRDGTSLNIFVSNRNDMSTPLADIEDVITVESWNVAANRIELLQFSNNFDFDLTNLTNTYLGQDVLGVDATDPIDDTLDGSGYADWIDGFSGNDILNGHNGDDFIFGRDGDDVISGGNGKDIISAGDGDDTINAGNHDDVVTGGAGDDIMNGDGGNDVLMGGSGNDTINGGSGADMIVGDLGDDFIFASAGQDQIRFGYGDGHDTYQGTTAHTSDDVMVFENNISSDEIWFDRIDNDLIVRLHGAEDTFTFSDWFHGVNSNNHIYGFAAGSEFLNYAQVNTLVGVMEPYVENLNDGTTAYGLLLGDTPDDVLTAIETAWG